jgi:CRISPR-associated protein Csb1
MSGRRLSVSRAGSFFRRPDILESNPLRLRYEVESADGRLESRTALEGETVRIRDGAVKPGGVTVAYALHTWTLSLTQLRRLRFPVNASHDDERNGATRAVLAALALYALALQREKSGYLLRSRCELLPEQKGLTLELLGGTSPSDTFTLGSSDDVRKELFQPAIEEAREKHKFTDHCAKEVKLFGE